MKVVLKEIETVKFAYCEIWRPFSWNSVPLQIEQIVEKTLTITYID